MGRERVNGFSPLKQGDQWVWCGLSQRWVIEWLQSSGIGEDHIRTLQAIASIFFHPLGEIRATYGIGGEGNGTPLQYSCLENPMDGGAWCAAVHGVAKGRTRLSDFTFMFYFHALEREMATHSSILAWRIPGTGEPGGLPSMGSHRIGHDWSDLAGAAAAVWDWSLSWIWCNIFF